MEKNKLSIDKVMVVLLLAAILVTGYNNFQVMGMNDIGISSSGPTVLSSGSKDIVDVIPKGVPPIYGDELGISFDDVSAYDPAKADTTIRALGDIDRNLELEGDDLERYIKVTTAISCEYCCGAKAITFSNGQPACGCAHSYAMRGLAKYLVTEHGSEYTDDEVLSELGKWKTLFFPAQITAKVSVLDEQGIELNYINLASNKYKGIEEGTTGGMVGGC
jgi:hypothetical protein